MSQSEESLELIPGMYTGKCEYISHILSYYGCLSVFGFVFWMFLDAYSLS